MTCPKSGLTYTCTDSGNSATNGVQLRETLLVANCGETIVLPHGATFTPPSGTGPNGASSFGGFYNCPSGNPTTIKSDALNSIAARATYSDIPNMATLQGISSDFTLSYANNAGGYVWQGILFTTANLHLTGHNPVVIFGAFDESGTAHDNTYDRCIIRPYEESLSNPDSVDYRSSSIGIRLDGVNNSVINSTIDGFCCFKSDGSEMTSSEGIGIVTGPGPYTITNNFIGAYGWNLFTGGGGDYSPANSADITGASYHSGTFNSTTNLHVGDIIRLNFTTPFTGTCYNAGNSGPNYYAAGKVDSISGSTVTWHYVGPNGSYPPLGTEIAHAAYWNPSAPLSGFTVTQNTLNKRAAWASNSGQCKSFWEMKDGSNVTFNGNILTGPVDVASAKLCPINTAFATNQSGANPWVASNNNTFTNNLMFGVGAIFSKQPYSAYCYGSSGSNVTFSNNLLTSGPRESFWINSNGNTWTISHNTVVKASTRIMASDPQLVNDNVFEYTENVVFKDNIVTGVQYYFLPTVNFATDYPSLNTNHNIIIDSGGCNGAPANCNGWAPGTGDHLFTMGSTSSIGYIGRTVCENIDSFGGGGDYHNCGLQVSSIGHNAASDSTDIGVNLTTLDAAISNPSNIFNSIKGLPTTSLIGISNTLTRVANVSLTGHPVLNTSYTLNSTTPVSDAISATSSFGVSYVYIPLISNTNSLAVASSFITSASVLHNYQNPMSISAHPALDVTYTINSVTAATLPLAVASNFGVSYTYIPITPPSTPVSLHIS